MVCILYGGQERIQDGIVAVLNLKVAPDAAPGISLVRVDRAVAVSKELKRFPVDPVESVVAIRLK